MSDFFDDHHRALQDRFETRALADRVATITVHTEIQESDKLFIESRTCFSSLPSMNMVNLRALTRAANRDSLKSWTPKPSFSQVTMAMACSYRWAT